VTIIVMIFLFWTEQFCNFDCMFCFLDCTNLVGLHA